MPRSERIIIDGYNVIRTNPSGSHIELHRGNEAARQWLIDLCTRAIMPGENWTVVFDGGGMPWSTDAGSATLTVRYAAPLSADEMIRDLAFQACAVGAGCLIVSSDRDVRAEGCAHETSADFYDRLLRRAGRERSAPDDGPAAVAQKFLAYLGECGHIDTTGFMPHATLDAVTQLLRYFGTGKHRPQKLARDMEAILREGIEVKPASDPQKLVHRAIKKFFETDG